MRIFISYLFKSFSYMLLLSLRKCFIEKCSKILENLVTFMLKIRQNKVYLILVSFTYYIVESFCVLF